MIELIVIKNRPAIRFLEGDSSDVNLPVVGAVVFGYYIDIPRTFGIVDFDSEEKAIDQAGFEDLQHKGFAAIKK